MTRLKATLASLAAFGAVIVGIHPAPAQAAPTFVVMNTSETPPDGVYFRNSPRTADTSKTTGIGVYKNETVSVDCYNTGEAVGQYGNTIWYYSHNTTRPTVNGRSNEGWLNTHYINDGQKANQVAPGVVKCGSTPTHTNATSTAASVFYSPYKNADDEVGYTRQKSTAAARTMYKPEWDRENCTVSEPTVANKTAKTIAGFSVGRSGVTSYLRTAPNHAASIDYVILFDPGNFAQLTNGCKSSEISASIQAWLVANPNAHLVIFAGEVSKEAKSPVWIGDKMYYHKGIQNVYFPAVRGTSTASRVTVCNYDNMSHEAVWRNFESWINKPVITETCPTAPAPDGTQPSAVWHP